MISLRKLNSFRLRSPSDSEIPKGPKFHADNKFMLVAGSNSISFSAPKHSPIVSSSSELLAKSQDVIDSTFRDFPSNYLAIDNWSYAAVFYRAWGFHYANFGGYAGQVGMQISILKRKEDFEINGSFFHPSLLEYVISIYLSNKYGWKTLNHLPRYEAPLNWVVKEGFPVPAASFDVQGEKRERVLIFPVTSSHFVEVTFSFSGDDSENVLTPMYELVDKVIASFNIELSNINLELIDQVNKSTENLCLTKSFAPFKWPISPEDIEKSSPLNELLSNF